MTILADHADKGILHHRFRLFRQRRPCEDCRIGSSLVRRGNLEDARTCRPAYADKEEMVATFFLKFFFHRQIAVLQPMKLKKQKVGGGQILFNKRYA